MRVAFRTIPSMKWLFAATMLAAFPLTLAGQSSRRKCDSVPIDSTRRSAPIYQACHVDEAAKLRGSEPRIDWEPGPGEARNGACFQAAFRFVVDTLGVPEAPTVELVSSNNSAFAEAVRVALSGLRYEPARIQKVAVRQMVEYRQAAAMRVTVSSSRSGGAPSGRPPRC